MADQANALVAIETLTPAIFSQEGGIDAMLAKIEGDVRSVATDISTPAGRKAVASLAHKVARSKTAFDSMGKELASEWKIKAKAIDTERARVWGRLEALQAEVRKPLDDFEAAEAGRVAGHEQALAAITQYLQLASTASPNELRGFVSEVGSIMQRDWQEFSARASGTADEVRSALNKALQDAEKREAEAAELARLRAEQAEREKREREEQIAATATRAAEERAAAEAAKAAAAAAEAQRKVEQEKAAAIAAAEKAKRDTEEAVSKAERDRVAAAKQAEADRNAAIEAERQRVAAEAAAAEREAARREADKAHKKTVNNGAKDALVAAGLSEADAIKAVTAIASGQVPNIKISY